MMHEGNAGSLPREQAPVAGPQPRRAAGPARLRRRTALAALLPLLPLMAASPAGAQWFGGEVVVREAVVPPGDVLRLLARRGYDEFSRPRFTGQAYVVDATDRRGDRVRVVVDAFEGEIRRIRLLEEERLTGALPRGRVERFGDEGRDAPPRGRQALRSDPPPRQDPPAAAPRPEKPASPAGPRKPEPPAAAVSPPAPGPEAVRRADPPPAAAPVARAPELAAPEPSARPAVESAPAEPRDRPDARGPVRVIEGVTPVIPQGGPKAEEG